MFLLSLRRWLPNQSLGCPQDPIIPFFLQFCSHRLVLLSSWLGVPSTYCPLHLIFYGSLWWPSLCQNLWGELHTKTVGYAFGCQMVLGVPTRLVHLDLSILTNPSIVHWPATIHLLTMLYCCLLSTTWKRIPVVPAVVAV